MGIQDQGDISSVERPAPRLRRRARREQMLDAATRAFARSGFAATSLNDVAAVAGVSKVLLYRHFESKADLYRAVLDTAGARLGDAVGRDDFGEGTIVALVGAAGRDPDGFRLLFRHAAREPEFRDVVDAYETIATDTARRNLARRLPEGPWLDWASRLVPVVTVEAVLAWLDIGAPDPDEAAARIGGAVDAVLEAARQHRARVLDQLKA